MVKPTYSRSNGSPWYVVKGQQRAYKRVETKSGLDKMLHNETAIRNALVPLLKWAEKQIPPYVHANIELFLLATAGLRRLPSEHTEWILDNVWFVLEKSPFKNYKFYIYTLNHGDWWSIIFRLFWICLICFIIMVPFGLLASF